MLEDLDKKDCKILYELDRNARATNSSISDEIRLSKEGTRYRINRLEEQDIVKDYVTIMNHKPLGLESYRIFFKLQDLTETVENEVVKFLKDKVSWLVRVRGEWSFNCMAFAETTEDLEKFILAFKERFKEHFVRYSMSIITRIYHYRRAYYLEDEKDTSEYDILGKQVDRYDLDQIDKKILHTIQNNARLNTLEISRRIDESERKTRYRLKKLEENDVILGYRAIPNTSKLGISYYKVHVEKNKVSQKIIEEMRRYCHENPHIVYKTETVGGPDLEIEYQVKDNKALYREIDKLIENFQGIIRDYRIMEYDKEYKLSYLNTV